jgi:hypothetical protein
MRYAIAITTYHSADPTYSPMKKGWLWWWSTFQDEISYTQFAAALNHIKVVEEERKLQAARRKAHSDPKTQLKEVTDKVNS